MVQTTRLQLPLVAAAQSQKHVTHNDAIMRLDGLVQMTAKSYTTSAQPGAPADGDLYLLPAGKSGSDWSGYSSHAAAHYYDGIWHQYHPAIGWLCWVQDSGVLFSYTGSSWSAVPLPNAIADGTAGAPGLAFASDSDTGLYRPGTDQIALTAGGTARRTLTTSAETATLPQQGADGSAASPQYSFSGDADTGLYRIGANNAGLSVGGALVQSFSASGNTQPLQPAFFAYLSSNLSNKTGDGTAFDIPFDSELFDRGGNISSGIFVAPISGLYLLGGTFRLSNLGSSHTIWEADLITTGGTFVPALFNPQGVLTTGLFYFAFSCLVPMSTGDTAKLRAVVYNSTKTVQVDGATVSRTNFWGCLIA